MNARLCAAFARELRAHWRKNAVRFETLSDLERWVKVNCETAHRAHPSPAVHKFLTKELSTKRVLAILKPEAKRRIREAAALAKKRGKKKRAPSKRRAVAAERGALPVKLPPASKRPSADDALRAVRKVAPDDRRVFVADVRDHMGGTKAEQDRALLELQRLGKVVLYNNDGPRASISKREWDGGVWLPGIERPRTILLRDIRGGG